MLRIIEGFDHYNDSTELTRKGWNGTYPSFTTPAWQTGRFSGSSLILYKSSAGTGADIYITKTLPSSEDVVYFGAAIKPDSTNVGYIGFTDSGSDQIGIKYDGSGTMGQFSIIRGGRAGTVLGATGYLYPLSNWCYIEAEFTVHDTTGVAKLWVNGVLVLDLSSQDTKATANASVNGFKIQSYTGSTQPFTIDDLYVGDDTGSYNTGHLGDRRVYTMYPTGDGANTDWAASAGSDYACVDEAAPNDDTDYISSSTVDQKETFTFNDLAANVSDVAAVQICHYSRKDDADARALKPMIRSGGSDYEVGAAQEMGSTYAFYLYISEEDPQDSTAWTAADVNAAEFGVVVDA